MVSTFSEKDFFFEFCIYALFSSCGGVHKSGDENHVKLYDKNLKLARIMPFWVYNCKRKLYEKIRHQISIKILKLRKKYF